MERTEIMNVELSCVTPGCKRCPGDEIWKTKSFTFIEAFESMLFHCDWYHAPIWYSEQDEEELYYTLLAGFESLSSCKNQHKNEDSQVPDAITLMVDQEESVASTAEHQPVQEQCSYPSVGQSYGEASTHDVDSRSQRLLP